MVGMRHRLHGAALALILLAATPTTASTPPAEPASTPSPSAGAAPTPASTLPADPAARVNALADAYVKAYFEHFPDQATAQGRADADNSRLPDNSLAGLDAWHDEEDALLDELDTVDGKRLGGRAQVTHDFLRELLEASIGARVCETELWNVSPTWTGWQANYTFLASVQPVGTAALRQAALTRLGQLTRYLDVETSRLREGLRRGYSAPQGNVQRVIEQMDGLLGGTAPEPPFSDPARGAGAPAFGAARAKVIDEQARPAIRRYRDFLAKDYLPAAREAMAVAANPQGAEGYHAA